MMGIQLSSSRRTVTGHHLPSTTDARIIPKIVDMLSDPRTDDAAAGT